MLNEKYTLKGLTFCDELAVKLLQTHNGSVDKAVPEILERLYPE